MSSSSGAASGCSAKPRIFTAASRPAADDAAAFPFRNAFAWSAVARRSRSLPVFRRWRMGNTAARAPSRSSAASDTSSVGSACDPPRRPSSSSQGRRLPGAAAARRSRIAGAASSPYAATASAAAARTPASRASTRPSTAGNACFGAIGRQRLQRPLLQGRHRGGQRPGQRLDHAGVLHRQFGQHHRRRQLLVHVFPVQQTGDATHQILHGGHGTASGRG